MLKRALSWLLWLFTPSLPAPALCAGVATARCAPIARTIGASNERLAAYRDRAEDPLSEFDEEGPTILLWGGFSGGSVRTGHWKAKRTNAWCDTALGRCPRTPSHWMPLPAPPARFNAPDSEE